MRNLIEELLFAFGTLFAIVNPFSTSLVFNKLTHGIKKEQRTKIALKASIAAFIAMILFLFSGNYILSFFGVTLYAFRVAGGIYLAWIGFEMLSPQLRKRPEHYDATDESIAIIPLAIPLLSGPGALTSVLVLASEVPLFLVILSILFVSLISFAVLSQAYIIQKFLGRVGTSVLERLMGIIVLVVAVQFVFNGISGYLATFL